MDSDSSDSEVVGPPLPPGYEVLLLIDVFGTYVFSVIASVITKRSFLRLCQCSVGSVALLNNHSHSQTPDLTAKHAQRV